MLGEDPTHTGALRALKARVTSEDHPFRGDGNRDEGEEAEIIGEKRPSMHVEGGEG